MKHIAWFVLAVTLSGVAVAETRQPLKAKGMAEGNSHDKVKDDAEGDALANLQALCQHKSTDWAEPSLEDVNNEATCVQGVGVNADGSNQYACVAVATAVCVRHDSLRQKEDSDGN